MPQDATSELDPDDGDAEAFVEVDPTGRYGRYKAVLGKGAFKKVYKAFDEWEGIEVAWNQVKVAELVRSSEDLERLYSEVNLLKTLKHKNIIKFYNSWVDTKNEHINFITEIFTSGTLRQYRKKHKRVDLRAVKKWSRQILEGLLYLHGHDPPIIHRDLKCDNIFVNGNNGEVKIGDLGFAAILRHANAAHSVIGTPEFMAPELYEEEYNELVDIYAFGMCVLELVTLEYPYVECSNAAQIYKKVTSGIKPASLAKVTEPSVRAFIEMCIANVSQRMSAEKLLIDPFLSPNENQDVAGHSLRIDGDLPDHGPTSWDSLHGDLVTGRDCIVHSERKDANTIFIKLRIADSTGQFRNIHFPFDIEADTSIAVASEMVHELDLTDQDVTNVADMIDSEIRAHIPEWSPRESSVDETVCESKDDSPLPITSAYSGSGLVLEQLSSGRKVWSDSPKVIGGHNSLGGWLMEEDEQISSSCVDSYEDEDTFKDDRTDGGGTIIENESVKAGYHMEDINYLHSVNQASSSLHSMTERGDNGKDVGKTRCGNLDVRLSSEADDEKDGNGCPNGGAAVESEEVRILVEKVEHLLLAQQKEMDQLKKKHGIIVSNLLKGVSPQIRGRVFELCKCNESSPLKPPMNESGASLQAVSLTTLGMAHSQTSLTTLGMAHSQTSLKSSSKAKEPITGGGEGLVVRPIFRDRLNSMKRRTNSDLGIAVILRDDLENT